MNVDAERLGRVAQAAFDSVAGDRRWEVAIAKAKRQIEVNPYMHYEGDTLLVLTPSNMIYRAGRSCQCKSYLQGRPCWHRAAARLMRRYVESLAGQ